MSRLQDPAVLHANATLTINQATTTTDPMDTTVCQGANGKLLNDGGGTVHLFMPGTVDGSPRETHPILAVDTTP